MSPVGNTNINGNPHQYISFFCYQKFNFEPYRMLILLSGAGQRYPFANGIHDYHH